MGTNVPISKSSNENVGTIHLGILTKKNGTSLEGNLKSNRAKEK